MFLSEFSQPGLIASMLACQNDSILLWVVNNLFQDGNPEGWLSRKVLASLKALWELVMVQSLRWWIPLKLWQRCLSHSPVAMPGMSCMPHPWNLVLHSSTRVKILPHPNLSQTHNPCPSLPCRIWFCLLLSFTCVCVLSKKAPAPWVWSSCPLAAGTHLSIYLNVKTLLLAPATRITPLLAVLLLRVCLQGTSLKRLGRNLCSSH